MSVAIEIKSSPQLSKPQLKINNRLIDEGLFHYEASIAGNAERYRRGETSHTVHVWWARRPHASMRMLTFATLCKTTDERALTVLSNLKTNNIKAAQDIINSQYSVSPKVLDMFGGGGTIPCEAANIGAQAYSVDSNELSVFIQKCNLNYSQKINPIERIDLIKESGARVLASLRNKTDKLFPLRNNGGKEDDATFGYIWSYSLCCPKCNYKYSLLKRPWLSKKHGKHLSLKLSNKKLEQVIEIVDLTSSDDFPSNWDGGSGRTICPKCNQVTERVDISDTRDEVLAVLKLKPKRGKEFLVSNNKKAVPDFAELKKIEKKLLTSIKCSLPQTPLPKWSGVMNPAGYGMKTYADFLNGRQRIVLLMLIESLVEEFKLLTKKKSAIEAKFVIGNLSSLIDQLVDWNCRLTTWISQNEQVGRAFCGPGVPMFWDYVETDPLMKGPANLWKKLDRIVEGVRSIPVFKFPVKVVKARAQKLPFENNYFDAIVTDPPYYDNVYYTALADFFYCWKRILLKIVEPELFLGEATDFKHELVASTFRNVDAKNAHESYCNQLTIALSEAERVLKKDGVISFVYSHSSFKGWEALIRAFRSSNILISSVQPLSIERKHRPRGISSEAINTCIVFIGRKGHSKKPVGKILELDFKIRKYCNGYAKALINSGWTEQDVALAIFAQGVGLIANCEYFAEEKDLCRVLAKVKDIVKGYYPSFNIVDRNPL